jgi:LacI family transcriptional regulator
VPDQIAVLGVDNDSVLCGVACPRLSSIELDGQRMGYEAATLLARMMGGKSCPEPPILVPPTQVVARESTDLLAVADAKVVEAVRVIQQFACQGIDVSHVADHIAMSRRTLERRFRACLGRTLKEELLRVKLEQAKMLLTQTDHPSKRIAGMCGFGSPYYFARAFRRETGETPCHYRQLTR